MSLHPPRSMPAWIPWSSFGAVPQIALCRKSHFYFPSLNESFSAKATRPFCRENAFYRYHLHSPGIGKLQLAGDGQLLVNHSTSFAIPRSRSPDESFITLTHPYSCPIIKVKVFPLRRGSYPSRLQGMDRDTSSGLPVKRCGKCRGLAATK